MKNLSINEMGRTDEISQQRIGGAALCGLSAFAVLGGIVVSGVTGGSAGLFLGSFIASNAAMAWVCITQS